MEYFLNLESEIEIKARYKELAKANHPDLGGCAETMKAINNQYEKCISGVYQRSGKSITEIDELLAKDVLLREKLNSIIALEGLCIEICGSWLWVTGATKLHKEILKACSFFWSNTKTAWYWRSEDKRTFSRGSKSLDDIRATYGSVNIERKSRGVLA